MATTFFFNGREIIEPGAYSQIISGIKNPIRELDYGRILLIDTGYWGTKNSDPGSVLRAGIDTGWGSGPGVDGELNSGKNAIQYFDNLRDFQTVVRGGPFWAAAPYLFQPKGFTIPGISGMYYIKAATTTAAKVIIGSGSNSIEIASINEGVVGNGVYIDNVYTESIEELKKGFLVDVRIGRIPDHFVADFWMGTYRGKDTDTIEWNGAVGDKSLAQLMFSSPEFKDYSVLLEWLEVNVDFKKWFRVVNSSITPGGGVVAESNSFKGGADIYDTFPSIALLEQVFEVIKELDYVFVLSDVYGPSVYENPVINAIIPYHIKDAKYDKYIQIGGGQNADEFNNTGTGKKGSIQIAEDLDTSRAVVVHGGFYKGIRRTGINTSSIQLKEYNSFFKAAITLGRILGKEPQVPGTFKTLDFDGEVHELKDTERETGLKKGVLMTKWDGEVNDFIIVQAVDTLQDNQFLVNEDGQSYEICIERIKAQLNKEIVVNARKRLLGQEEGTNRNTLSAQDLKIWIENYLQTKTATVTDDNLILSYQNVSVETKQDAHICRYEFVPNFPVNKLIFTGVIIDI